VRHSQVDVSKDQQIGVSPFRQDPLLAFLLLASLHLLFFLRFLLFLLDLVRGWDVLLGLALPVLRPVCFFREGDLSSGVGLKASDELI
jgi:hypothetical protein